MKYVMSIIALLMLNCPVWAARKCDALATGASEYKQAINAVRKLPEFHSWSAAHSLPVVFSEPMDREVKHKGKCFWSVTVYVNRLDRLERWQSFLASSAKGVAYVQGSTSGENISLAKWHKQVRQSKR